MFKYPLLMLLILFTQHSYAQVPSAFLHKVNKDEIFRTFEVKPFVFNSNLLQGKGLEEAKVIVTQAAITNAGENLLALANYAYLPTSFYAAEMAEIRLKALLSVSRINDVAAFHQPQFQAEVNRLVREQLEIFIQRPYLDTYFDMKEVVKQLKELQASSQNDQTAKVATQDKSSEENGFLGIKVATPLNLSLLALVLAILSLVNSSKKTSNRR